MKIIVLGAGLVGGPMAIDLAKDSRFEITVADKSAAALQRLGNKFSINKIVADLSAVDKVKSLVRDYDLVLSAVPGFMGFSTLEAIIEAGKDVVDIAFFPEDPFLLDELARKKGITAIVDCGVAPGMSNVFIGRADQELDRTDTVLIYVGGLPEIREWPYEYRAVFSPVDVIEEYTRPARYVENGALVTRPALSDPEFINFPMVGTLEAFNSDGLRTLAKTIDAPNLKEKTLRYPGHIEKMAVLRETGFFNKEEIEIDGRLLRPLDFTAKILFPNWQMKEGEGDITVMKIVVSGQKDGKDKSYTYELFDSWNRESGTLSMARTTGYTATAAIRMMSKKMFTRRGICPPEYIGLEPECAVFMRKELEARGVVYKETIT